MGAADKSVLYYDILAFPPASRVIFALYDGNGKVLSCEVKDSGELCAFRVDSPGAALAKVIVTDEHFAPLRIAKTLNLT